VEAGKNVWRGSAACTSYGKTIELEFFHLIWAGRQGDLFNDNFISVANIT
jgi:hypothetical protein